MMVLKMLFEIMEVDIITTIYTLPVLNLEAAISLKMIWPVE